MAAIRRDVLKDGTRRYRVRVRKGGQYASFTSTRKAEAERKAAMLEQQFTLDRQTPLGRSELMTFGEVVERYRRQVLRFKKPHTQRQQDQQLGWWLAFFGTEAPLVNITPPVISLAKDELEPRSPKTINRYLAVLSHLFTVALKEWRLVEINPVTAVTRLPEGKGRTRRLLADERKRLSLACMTSGNRMLYTIMAVALSTGGRKDEIRTARWSQVDLFRTMAIDGRQVEVGRIYLEETKTDESRTLVLYGEALRLMRKLHRERNPAVPWCFPSPREEYRPINFRTAWENALDKADIENFCFHDLRHSAASCLGEQGASLAQIGAILGHKNPATTKRYTHFTATGNEHLIARMGRDLFRGGV